VFGTHAASGRICDQSSTGL